MFQIIKVFMTFGNAKSLQNHILLELFKKKIKCKNEVSIGWCKESNV